MCNEIYLLPFPETEVCTCYEIRKHDVQNWWNLVPSQPLITSTECDRMLPKDCDRHTQYII